MALTLLLADGSRITCSRLKNAELFVASICGLGSTGLILAIQLEVEPAFRLREVQETFKFEHVIQNLDRFVFAAEHVRIWWFPTSGSMRVSSSDRTYEVKKNLTLSRVIISILMLSFSQAKHPANSWFWHSLLGYHLVQFILFVARYLLFLNFWTGCFAAWLVREKTLGIDDSHVIFNVDCRVGQISG